MSDLATQIETAATSPQKASGDSGSVEMPSLQDMIAADKHLANKTAAQSRTAGVIGGLRIQVISPPGTI